VSRSFLRLLIPATVMVSSVAYAAETGNIRGKIEASDGEAVPGARVTILGANMAGSRQATTGVDGSFQISNLPPGTHQAIIEAPGFSTVKTPVTIRLDETVFFPLTLKVNAGEETIVAEQILPVIDTSRTSVSTEITAQALANMPIGRSYQDAVNTVPGVYGRVNTQEGGPSSGNPSVRGEGSYGNNYYVDGISTRDPATKTFGSDVSFDAIESIQVYTDGAPAEFSQATGMMVNVVTKDGGDEHFGSAAYYLSMDAATGTTLTLNLETGEEEATKKRDFFSQSVAVTAGGPIVKEKLWYFISLDAGLESVNFEGADPDAPYGGPSAGGFAKFTWFATPDVTLQYQVSPSYTQVDNYDTSGAFAAEAQAKYQSSDLGHILTLRARPSANNEIELKGSYLGSSINVGPMSGDMETPQFFSLDTGQYYSNWSDTDINRRSRLGGSLKFTQIVEDMLGDHRFKTGVEYWKLKDSRELDHTGPGDGIQWTASEDAGLPCTTEGDLGTLGTGYTDCAGFTAYKSVGELAHDGRILGLFLQDDWKPVEPVTLNLGVRVDRETLFQNEGDKVVSQWMPAPRLGLAWDITNDSKTLFAVNAGRYFDVNGNSFGGWADTRSAFVFEEWQYDGDITDVGIEDGVPNYYLGFKQDPEANPLVYCTDESLAQYEDHLKELGYLDDDIKAAAKVADNTCDGRLAPYHMDKLVVGLKREIIPFLAIGLRGILSQTNNLPEDVDADLNTWVIANPDVKSRDYRALELTLERKLKDNWQGMIAYTLSESRGTNPGQFELASGGQTGSNGNEVGVFLDDVNDKDVREGYYQAGYGWLLDGLHGLGTQDDIAGWYGYLPYHSFHQIKASGFYSFDFGTTLGLVYEYDSGHAWQKRGLVELYGDYMAFPEGRGTRFMPAVHYVDFRVAHKFTFKNEQSIEGSLDVFNLPDFDKPITYYENDNASFGKVLFRQEPRAIRAGLKYTY